VFTTEAPSSQRSENFYLRTLYSACSALRGAISESCFTGKAEDPFLKEVSWRSLIFIIIRFSNGGSLQEEMGWQDRDYNNRVRIMQANV